MKGKAPEFIDNTGRTWNKGKRGIYDAETRMRMGAKNKGRKWSEEAKKQRRVWSLGRKLDVEARKKIRASKLGKARPMLRGANHPFWKGGVTARNHTERHIFMRTLEYTTWRRLVFERDNYTCKICNKRDGSHLQAHHIKPYAKYPELRVEVSNGITLCEPCHETLRRDTLKEIRT